MERANLNHALIGLVLRQNPDYGKRLIKRIYKHLSTRQMPQFEAKNWLHQIETKGEAWDAYRLSLMRPLLIDFANLMPQMNDLDMTHVFVNYPGTIKMKRFILGAYQYKAGSK